MKTSATASTKNIRTRELALIWCVVLALALSPGCTRERKQVTERDRKEAALLVSEAQFAITLRDWARAEGLLAKAVQLSPESEYWMSLGFARVRVGNRTGAKQAYEAALKVVQDDAALDTTGSEPWLRQANILALLGRTDDARAVLTKAAKRFPKDGRVQSLLDPKQFQQMITAPGFKENAL